MEATLAKQIDKPIRAQGAASRVLPQPDFLITITVLGLVLFGIVMVFSASYYSTINSKEEDPFLYLIQASKWAVTGVALMIVVSYVPYRIYYKWAPMLMVFGVLLLCALFVPGIGSEGNNAVRWIKMGPVTIMPGEIAKITAIFFIAWFFTKYRSIATSFKYAYVPMMILTGTYFILIYKQPNLSTAIIVCGIVAILTCIAGNPKKYLALTGAAGFVGVYALIQADPSGEHFERFTGFLDPFADPRGAFYQTVQALLALGAGGVTGVGPGRSIQKALYLPYAQNDFIFAIIGEELGFLGCLAVLCAFLFLIWRCAFVAINAPDRFGMLVASGVTVWLALQVTMNIAVVTSVMPPTGVTLPFISYGGNAIIITMAAVGVVLNISRESAKISAAEADKEAKGKDAEGSIDAEAETPPRHSRIGRLDGRIYGESNIGRRGDGRSSLSGASDRG
ncbi:MAG: putative lipid II flippase FtsW [Clostridiales Family XIII bacterium]|jgi:cell division protein FtsW|nr:putative lipid II flippase FtsW [Clostridiales Family XIII bacterium]